MPPLTGPAPSPQASRSRRRVYASPEQFQGGMISLSLAETHHLIRVLRLVKGDEVEVVDGCGRIVTALISRLTAQGALLQIVDDLPVHGESPLHLTVGLALVRADAFDLLVRQLTEMGVKQLVPFYAHRSLARPETWQPQKLARWQRLAQDALKSSERAYLPTISPPVAFSAVLEGVEDFKLLCWEDLRHGEGRSSLIPVRQPQSVRLLIGPEGGFTKEEVAAAQTAGFHPMGLGPRRLRVETATVAAVSLVQYLWGDMRP